MPSSSDSTQKLSSTFFKASRNVFSFLSGNGFGIFQGKQPYEARQLFPLDVPPFSEEGFPDCRTLFTRDRFAIALDYGDRDYFLTGKFCRIVRKFWNPMQKIAVDWVGFNELNEMGIADLYACEGWLMTDDALEQALHRMAESLKTADLRAIEAEYRHISLKSLELLRAQRQQEHAQREDHEKRRHVVQARAALTDKRYPEAVQLLEQHQGNLTPAETKMLDLARRHSK